MFVFVIRYSGQGNQYCPASPRDHYRQVFLEAYDIAVVQLRQRFDESKPSLVVYNNLMDILKTGIVNKEVVNYAELEEASLQSELMVFRKQWHISTLDEYSHTLRSASSETRALFPFIETLVRLLLVRPVSSAESERSFSALRRLKSWLRSTMTQTRLNAVAISHVHAKVAKSLNIKELVKFFIVRNSSRVQLFGN
jgi:hypothetical protein